MNLPEVGADGKTVFQGKYNQDQSRKIRLVLTKNMMKFTQT